MKKIFKKIIVILIIIFSTFSIFSLTTFAYDDEEFFSLDFSDFYSENDGEVSEYYDEETPFSYTFYYHGTVTYNLGDIKDLDLIDFEDYEFDNEIEMNYSMSYDEKTNVFVFSAYTHDKNGKVYSEVLYGTPYMSADGVDVVFYDDKTDDYVLLSDLAEKYKIDYQCLALSYIMYGLIVGICLAATQLAMKSHTYTAIKNTTPSNNSTLSSSSVAKKITEIAEKEYVKFIRKAEIIYASIEIGIYHLTKYLQAGFENLEEILSSLNGDTIDSIDDILGLEIVQEELSEFNITDEDIRKCLLEFLFESETSSLDSFYNTDKKVLCIGRDLSRCTIHLENYCNYHYYAEINNYWRFYSPKFDSYVNDFGGKIVEKANDVLIIYCIKKDWDFILVTNPYHYMEEHLKENKNGNTQMDFPHNGRAYYKEIKTIRESNSYDLYMPIGVDNNANVIYNHTSTSWDEIKSW